MNLGGNREGACVLGRANGPERGRRSSDKGLARRWRRRKNGLRAGDVILEVDGKAVATAADFNKAVKEAKENKVIPLKIQRGTAKVFLGSPLG